jgi:tetratricopeptide (TPR) repeat protein
MRARELARFFPARPLLLAAALAVLLPLPLAAQAAQGDTLDSLSSKARDAISRNSYETAVKILSRAKQLYPSSPRPNLALGDLYYDKELYTLALREYRDAETRGADDFSTLTQISRCYGKLNQEKKSIDYLTRILARYPDSSDTVDDLGWMYFKTHQLEKGEQVLLKGIARLGMQRGMAMTLGTVYSGLNRYDKSRQYYLKSVDEALRIGDREFAAIAYYNLSLLEHNFFHYNSALRFTDESIATGDRPSGHLARGELFQARMDFDSAEQEYQDAYAKDTTPLSKVNLSILFQKFGRLDLARRYAEEVVGSKDLAWLLYYGTDITRHFKDMYELLSNIYRGLARREAGRPTTGILDRVAALISAARSQVVSWYYAQRFHLYSLQVGKDYLNQGSFEDAWWEFFKGNESYPDVALKYLAQARALETERTPHAEVFYTLEEGKVRHSAALLQQAFAGFDPFWEKEPAAEALIALVPLLKGAASTYPRREAIARLFAINPGALPQAGIGLPLAVDFRGDGWSAREKALIFRYLRRAGSECAEGSGAGFRHALRLTRGSDGAVRWAVVEAGSGSVIREGNPPLTGRTKQRCARLIQAVLADLYAVH